MTNPVHRFADPQTIATAVRRLANEIEHDHRDPVLIGILKGCLPFLADLSRAMTITPTIDFLAISQFGEEAKQGGVVRIIKDIDTDINHREVVIVEDIVDSGLTLSYLRRLLLARAPTSLRICSLLDRPAQRTSGVVIDYVGMTAPDAYLVGYGLDLLGHHRNLRGLWVVDDPEVLKDPEVQRDLLAADAIGS